MLFEKIKEVEAADDEMLRLEGSEGGPRVPQVPTQGGAEAGPSGLWTLFVSRAGPRPLWE